MKTKITRLKPNSDKAKKVITSLDKAFAESAAYVKSHGGNSTEGFYRTQNGPRGIE